METLLMHLRVPVGSTAYEGEYIFGSDEDLELDLPDGSVLSISCVDLQDAILDACPADGLLPFTGRTECVSTVRAEAEALDTHVEVTWQVLQMQDLTAGARSGWQPPTALETLIGPSAVARHHRLGPFLEKSVVLDRVAARSWLATQRPCHA